MEKQPQRQREKRLGTLRNGNPACDIRAQPRCQAKAKSTGTQCGNIAMKGKRVCQLHGGRSPGPPKGNQNAYVSGRFTAKAKKEREELKKSIQEHLSLLEEIMHSGV